MFLIVFSNYESHLHRFERQMTNGESTTPKVSLFRKCVLNPHVPL